MYYRDTLIGSSEREITRGTNGGYGWTITADTVIPGRMLVSVRKLGTNTRVPLEDMPHYIAHEILLSISSEA